VSKQGFWESAMDDVSVDNKNLGLKGRTAILDTGQFSRKELLIIIDCV